VIFLISILICSIPFAAIAFPLLRKIATRNPAPADESSLDVELDRRWRTALEGMTTSEIEFMVGNLSKADYLSFRESYILEASIVLQMAQFSQDQQQEILDQIERESSQISLDEKES
tara:strand:- start:518 stop:868 length:351 start_codon:yes stop_codon:yes gene_type:complete